MQPSETARWPEKGQFWASLSPLYLVELTDVNADMISFAGLRWTPNEARSEVMWVGPMKENFRYLWQVSLHNKKDLDPKGECKFQVGDIFLLFQGGPDAHEQLVFIGPETNDEMIQVCTDFPFLLYPNGTFMTLYQPGPGRQLPPGRTAWDHLKAE